MKIPSFFLNNTITTNNNLFRCQNLTALHEINSKEIHPHLPLSATSNKHNNIWKSINSILFKVTLSQPSPFSILKFPFTIFCQLLAVKCLPGILHFAWPWTCSNPSCQQIPCRRGKPHISAQEIAITITHNFQLQNQQLLTWPFTYKTT